VPLYHTVHIQYVDFVEIFMIFCVQGVKYYAFSILSYNIRCLNILQQENMVHIENAT